MPKRKYGCPNARYCTGDHDAPTNPMKFWECCNADLEQMCGTEFVKGRKPVAGLSKKLGLEPSFLDTLKAFPFNGKTSLRAFSKNKVAQELIKQFI
jgi:hypothetical protein